MAKATHVKDEPQCEACPSPTPKCPPSPNALNTSPSILPDASTVGCINVLFLVCFFLIFALDKSNMLLVLLGLSRLCIFTVILRSHNLLFSLGKNILQKRRGGEQRVVLVNR